MATQKNENRKKKGIQVPTEADLAATRTGNKFKSIPRTSQTPTAKEQELNMSLNPTMSFAPTTPQQKGESKNVPVFTDTNGNITGFEAGGGTFLGNPSLIAPEVKKLADKKIAQQTVPEGATSITETQQRQQSLLQAQAAIAQGISPTNPNVQLGSGTGDLVSNVATNIPAIGAGIASGATLGAGIGSVVPGVGNVVGGITGGLIGGISAYLGKLAIDKRQTTKESIQVFRRAKGVRNTELLNMANNQMAAPADLIAAYELNLANIREAQRELEFQTRSATVKQLSGAQDELNEVNDYLRMEYYYRGQLLNAIAMPKAGTFYSTSEELNTAETLF